MAPHSSTLAWKIPWTEEPGRLQSMGSLRVGHDWAISLYFSLSCIGEGNGNPLQCSCLENPRDGRAWWAAVYGVAQSRTRLKRLSSFFWTIRVDDWEQAVLQNLRILTTSSMSLLWGSSAKEPRSELTCIPMLGLEASLNDGTHLKMKLRIHEGSEEGNSEERTCYLP